jgi:hypothetical protein
VNQQMLWIFFQLTPCTRLVLGQLEPHTMLETFILATILGDERPLPKSALYIKPSISSTQT